MIGTKLSLLQQQRALRYSYVAWLLWLGVVIPLWQSQWIGLSNAWGLALIAVVPVLLMSPWVWRGKSGSLLMLVGMILLIYFCLAILAALRGGWSMLVYGVEVILITHTLFWLMWVVERLPKLNQS